jgi:transcriptional regulator with XRE-family HTH domain
MRIYGQAKGWTQEKLGELLGSIPRRHVSNMERGKRPINSNTAWKLAKLFNVPIDRFISDRSLNEDSIIFIGRIVDKIPIDQIFFIIRLHVRPWKQDKTNYHSGGDHDENTCEPSVSQEKHQESQEEHQNHYLSGSCSFKKRFGHRLSFYHD